MFFVIILFFVLICVWVVSLAKFLLRVFFGIKPKEKITEKGNPYIDYHKKKMQNDVNYDDYLKWVENKNVYGVPVDKVEDVNEKEASRKANELIPRRKFDETDNLL